MQDKIELKPCPFCGGAAGAALAKRIEAHDALRQD